MKLHETVRDRGGKGRFGKARVRPDGTLLDSSWSRVHE